MTAPRDKKARNAAYVQGFLDGFNVAMMLKHPEDVIKKLDALSEIHRDVINALQGKSPQPTPMPNVGNELDAPQH